MPLFCSYMNSEKLFLLAGEKKDINFHFPFCFFIRTYQVQPPQNHQFSPKETERSGKWLPAWELENLRGILEIFVMVSQGVCSLVLKGLRQCPWKGRISHQFELSHPFPKEISTNFKSMSCYRVLSLWKTGIMEMR